MRQKQKQKPAREQAPKQEQEPDPSTVAAEMNIPLKLSTLSEVFLTEATPLFNVRGRDY